MSQQNLLLNDAVEAYYSGNMEEFMSIAKSIYNACAVFPTPIINAQHKYLMGTVFAYFAPFNIRNIDVYTTAIENAYYCLSTVVIKTEYTSEKNCAAIRLLLLIDENRQVMLHIASRFVKERSSRISNKPALNISVLNSIMNNAYDEDVLRIIGGYLIHEISSNGKNSFISENEMQHYNEILRQDRYSTMLSLFDVTAETLFMEMHNFVLSVINMPYERRITQLR